MALSQMPDLLQDRVVAAIGDRYDVEGEVGRGGMAVVYRAKDVRLRRRVALKILPPDLAFREGVRARFLREAETAAQLSHPHIVPIYAADETQGLAWLAMALIDGETLGARMSRAPRMTPDETRRVLAEVADALAYAHARGVVHRDIKPDNILLDRDTGRAMVTDFGIARAAEADTRLTVTGIAVGTPTYMSPEQALGERECDGRSDQYSLAVVGYQMLAGVPPFQATSAAALLMKHVGEKPTPITQLRPDAPPALTGAIDKALAKKPEDRWIDASEFRRAVLGNAPLPPAPRAPEPTIAMPIDDVRDEVRHQRELLREQRRLWKERQRHHREEMRDAIRQNVDQHIAASIRASLPVPHVPNLPPMPGMPERLSTWSPAYAMGNALSPLEHRADAFRRRTWGMIVLLTFLTFINFGSMAASGVPFPWVIFPMMGILGGVRRRWRPLAREGLSFWDVMFGGASQATAARAQAASRVQRNVQKLKRRANVFIGAAIASAVSFVIGISFNAEVLIAPMILFGVIAVLALLSGGLTALRVRRAGITVRQAFSARWEDAVAAADTRPREVIINEEASRLVAADVLGGAAGRAVRAAIDDRMTVRETMAKLSPTDRALLPDVMPTIDALVQRVAELAQSLHRLDGDISPTQLAAIEERLRVVQAEPETAPDHERKVQLLQRQHASVLELIDKRNTFAAQMESAQLVLQNLKFDLIKLRSKGVGAAIGEVSSATQEARVISRDIANALHAANEVRAL